MPTAQMKREAKFQELYKTAPLMALMGGRLKLKHGQLVPLKQRLNRFQMQKRADKTAARQTVAEQLRSEQQKVWGVFTQVLNHYFKRGFFGRMKWVLVGK